MYYPFCPFQYFQLSFVDVADSCNCKSCTDVVSSPNYLTCVKIFLCICLVKVGSGARKICLQLIVFFLIEIGAFYPEATHGKIKVRMIIIQLIMTTRKS